MYRGFNEYNMSPYMFDGSGVDYLLEIMFSAIFALVLVVALVFLVFYILESIGYYSILKNRGYNKAYFAWIPYLRTYAKGTLADDINIKSYKKTSYGKILGNLALVNLILVVIGLISFIANIFVLVFLCFSLLSIARVVMLIFKLFALYIFYNDYHPENSVLYLILSIFIPIVPSIVAFISKNKRPISLGVEQKQKNSNQGTNYTGYRY